MKNKILNIVLIISCLFSLYGCSGETKETLSQLNKEIGDKQLEVEGIMEELEDAIEEEIEEEKKRENNDITSSNNIDKNNECLTIDEYYDMNPGLKEFLQNRKEYGLKDEDEFILTDIDTKNNQDYDVYFYQQVYKTLPVEGGYYRAYIDKKTNKLADMDFKRYDVTLSDDELHPVITREEVEKYCDDKYNYKIDLVIYYLKDDGEKLIEGDSLAWRITNISDNINMEDTWIYYIDAITGKILNQTPFGIS